MEKPTTKSLNLTFTAREFKTLEDARDIDGSEHSSWEKWFLSIASDIVSEELSNEL